MTDHTCTNSTRSIAVVNRPCGSAGARGSVPSTMIGWARGMVNQMQMKTCEFHPDGRIYKACGEPATRIVLLPHVDDCRTMHVCDSCFLLGIAWWDKCGIKFEL